MKEIKKMRKIGNKTRLINDELFEISDTLNKETVKIGQLKYWKEEMRNIRENVDEMYISINNIVNELEIK